MHYGFKPLYRVDRLIHNRIILLLISFSCIITNAFSQKAPDDILGDKLDKEIQSLMRTGDVPGLTVVINKDNKQLIRSYGYSDLKHKIPVTDSTLFQIGSCSKAFTALAVARLASSGFIDLNKYVSDYIPGLTFKYKDSLVKVTLEQLLHHTSGIPWSTVSLIPESTAENALEQTVLKIKGIELSNLPGKAYEYATIGYDVLALVIEKASHQKFETYLTAQVFEPLGLTHTAIGTVPGNGIMAEGYKVSFYRPRHFAAPEYKGNNAAGYVITNAIDMGKWLTFQMGLGDSLLYPLAAMTHVRDESVPLHDMASYAMGWNVSLKGDGQIYHEGLNPNFSAFTAFRPAEKIGIAILTNSGSTITPFIGQRIMKRLTGEEVKTEHIPANEMDKTFSMLSFIFIFYSLFILGFLGKVVRDIIKGHRKYEGLSKQKVKRFLIALIMASPFLAGIYLFPKAYANFDWDSILVWTPYSFGVMILSIVGAIFLSYVVYLVTMLYPEKNPYKRILPRILLFSLLSGISSMVLITLVTNSIYSQQKTSYMIFYYTLVLLIYLLGRWFVQATLIRLTRNMVYELRVELISKIFSTSYQKFEQIDRGRIYTTLNNDISFIGESLNIITGLVTNCFTALGAFLYLGSLAFWATCLTILLIVAITALYYVVTQKTNKYFEAARDTENKFMRMINGLIDGFKELSLHKVKKEQYKADIAEIAVVHRDRMTTAGVRFTNAFLVGESMLVVLLGIVAFGLPKMFDNILPQTIMSFVIVLLYLIGPVNNILGSIPSVLQLRVARRRVTGFINDIPVTAPAIALQKTRIKEVETFRAAGVKFQYRKNGEEQGFTTGPINLELARGEIIFIIGGNGSGKSTLGKLLTGLYEPDEGSFLINNTSIDSSQLGEYFSTVFASPYIFEKLYNINTEDQADKISEYLKLLHLDQKVKIENGRYSTLELSTGQLKRLALLQCFLEQKPIYLFDEWAADQDPEYRSFFYNHLLPDLKSQGKIIIAITHDDNYFYAADKILKMENGRLETRYREFRTPVAETSDTPIA